MLFNMKRASEIIRINASISALVWDEAFNNLFYIKLTQSDGKNSFLMSFELK